MGAGRGEVRSRGPQVRIESGVFRRVRDLVGGALPAVAEAVAVAVHLQDMDVVGEPVQQRAGEAFRFEHLGDLGRPVGLDGRLGPLSIGHVGSSRQALGHIHLCLFCNATWIKTALAFGPLYSSLPFPNFDSKNHLILGLTVPESCRVRPSKGSPFATTVVEAVISSLTEATFLH